MKLPRHKKQQKTVSSDPRMLFVPPWYCHLISLSPIIHSDGGWLLSSTVRTCLREMDVFRLYCSLAIPGCQSNPVELLDSIKSISLHLICVTWASLVSVLAWEQYMVTTPLFPVHLNCARCSSVSESESTGYYHGRNSKLEIWCLTNISWIFVSIMQPVPCCIDRKLTAITNLQHCAIWLSCCCF